MGSVEGFEEEELLIQICAEPAHGMLHTKKGDVYSACEAESVSGSSLGYLSFAAFAWTP